MAEPRESIWHYDFGRPHLISDQVIANFPREHIFEFIEEQIPPALRSSTTLRLERSALNGIYGISLTILIPAGMPNETIGFTLRFQPETTTVRELAQAIGQRLANMSREIDMIYRRRDREWEYQIAQARQNFEQRIQQERMVYQQAVAQMRVIAQDAPNPTLSGCYPFSLLEIYKSHSSMPGHKRAEVLLLDHLTPEQGKCYKNHRYFNVTTPAGHDYHILYMTNSNVLAFKGQFAFAQLCVVAKEEVPIPDQMLMQKLILETNEKKFLLLAKRPLLWELAPQLPHILDVPGRE